MPKAARETAPLWRIALLQHNSVPPLDDGAEGAVAGLAEHGFREGDNLEITRYNAHGDFGTSNTIAREILNRPFDLVLTMSTPSLQAVAGANKDRQMPHVFGLVADPFSAGVGLDRAHPAKHPPYMVGQAILFPVEESFRLAKEMNPALNTIGVVWNPGESNSQIFTANARVAAKALNLNLLEATVDSSAGVQEATQSLIGRGVQTIWVGGDTSVTSAIDSVIAAARKAGIPVFSINPGKPDRGTLFDAGANFYDTGKLAGALAADVLKGADPASIPIRDVFEVVGRRLIVNRKALAGLKEPWRMPDDVVRRADVVVDDNGIHEQKPGK